VHRSQASDALILVGQDGVQRPPIQFPKGKFSSIKNAFTVFISLAVIIYLFIYLFVSFYK
jgi:hypothetical protein